MMAGAQALSDAAMADSLAMVDSLDNIHLTLQHRPFEQAHSGLNMDEQAMSDTVVTGDPPSYIKGDRIKSLLKAQLLHEEPPRKVTDPHIARCKELLETRAHPDFYVIASGVEWHINEVFLHCGSERIAEYLAPENRPNSYRHETLNLPYHPMLIDRLIEFSYTGRYGLDGQGNRSGGQYLRHATILPRGKNRHDYTLSPHAPLRFHLRMYKLGEQLKYPELMECALEKLTTDLVVRNRGCPNVLAESIRLVYENRRVYGDIMCEDANDLLKQTLLVGTLLRDCRVWSSEDKDLFQRLVYTNEGFVADWAMAAEEHAGMMAALEKKGAKALKEGRLAHLITSEHLYAYFSPSELERIGIKVDELV